MSEHQFAFFRNEWDLYKRATGIRDQTLCDELWSCMSSDLKRLAYDQGDVKLLNTEDLMMERIKSLAVAELHPSVHTVRLHESQQAAQESVKAFSARVRGVASNCRLKKNCGCGLEVSYLDETVYHVVMAGLRDREMQERVTTQALMGTVTDLKSLVTYCTAEESGRLSTPDTVGGMRNKSSYRKEKDNRNRNSQPLKCQHCGGGPHSSNSITAREKECKAFKATCRKCGIKSHFSGVCKSKTSIAAVEKGEDEATNAAYGFYGIACHRGSHYDLHATPGPENHSVRKEAGPRTPYKAPPSSSPPGLRMPSKVPPSPSPPEHRTPYKVPPSSSPPGLRMPYEGPPSPSPQAPYKMPPSPRTGGAHGHDDRTTAQGLDGRLASIELALRNTQQASLPMCHMMWGPYGWQQKKCRPSPTLPITLAVHSASYRTLGLPLPDFLDPQGPDRMKESAIPDSGAQLTIVPLKLLKKWGIAAKSLLPVNARVSGASQGSVINLLGALIVMMTEPETGNTWLELAYVADNVHNLYLCLGCGIGLGIFDENFPRAKPRPAVCAAAEAAAEAPHLPACTNSGVISPGDQPCRCPERSLPPTDRPVLPCPATEENVDKLEQYILDRFHSSAFNCCERQKLPLIKDTPPLKIYVDPEAKPVAAHVPSPVPLHWQEGVKGGLDRDCRLGVIERVPPNTPVRWLSRMVLQTKANGEPRRTVDFQPLNKHAPRQTHHTRPPWQIVASIPAGVKKSTLDNWNSYHSLEIEPDDRDLTQFITSWGRYRYRTCPQGLLSAGDAFTQRMDLVTEGTERLERCVDDNLLYDGDIETQFFRVCTFLETCASKGIVFNPKKFKFARDTVEFLGFTVTSKGVQPTESFLKNIMQFPTPANITDIRSWYGAVAQISYSFASAPIMEPFRHLLSSKVPFSWSPELEHAFKESKLEILRQCKEGVTSFSLDLPTCLATDWSKLGIGFWLCQKHCDCEEVKPGCCKTGWQTTMVGSRFCSPPEQRYAPIEGESLAASWAMDKCRYFLLGLPHFTLAVDHKPLISIFGDKDLGTVTNHRIMHQKVKTLPYRFTPTFVPGKFNVIPDCWSRRSDSPLEQSPPSTRETQDISNVTSAYSSHLGPPDWVNRPQPGDSSTLAFIRVCATQEEMQEAEDLELYMSSLGRASIAALHPRPPTSPGFEDWDHDFLLAGQAPVTMLSWGRLQAAVQESPLYQSLLSFLRTDVPEDKSAWPEGLRAYYLYRNNLQALEDVVLYGDRPLIPASLRPEVLEHLHAAHSGVTGMYSRASQSVFWPNMKQDIIAKRLGCKACTVAAPSNPHLPPTEPVQPSYPFSHICMDFFTVEQGNYLEIVDRYSGWLSIFRLVRDDSANVIAVLREYFATWGAAEETSSDGASVFTSAECKDFFERWGVRHRVSSAYHARSNKRAEIGVKSAKRLVMENLGPNGSLNTDKLARALMIHRNTPDCTTGLSPAMVVLGRELRDHLPSYRVRYQPRQEWRLEADMREKAYAKRHLKSSEQLTAGSKHLPPLSCGDTVAVQDQSDHNKPGKWTKSGRVVEVQPFDSYLVLIHGSRDPTKRNRKFLRKIQPFTPALPVQGPMLPPVTRAQSRGTAVAKVPATAPEVPVTEVPETELEPAPLRTYSAPSPVPTQASRSYLPSPSTYRLRPAAPPGEGNLLELLKEQEHRGIHLAVQART